MDSSSIPFRSHTALLLAAALPYLQPAYRHPVELALKFLEFTETMKLYREFHLPGKESTECFHETEKPSTEGFPFDLISRYILDPEGLLCSLSNVCTGKEKSTVNMLLNLLRAKNIYENYGDVLNMFMNAAPQQESEAAPAPSASDIPPQDMASMLSSGDLSSMLNEEQTETLNLLKSLLEAE